jgi:hypothetical protein
MGRRSVNNVTEIKYPSRVEGWIEVCGEFKFVTYMNCVVEKLEAD